MLPLAKTHQQSAFLLRMSPSYRSPIRNWSTGYRVTPSSVHRPITITPNLPAEQSNGKKRLILDWKKDNLPAFTNEDEEQIPQECKSRKMKVDEMNARMYVIQLKATHKHIGLKAVGMAGRCWMTKDINDKLLDLEDVRRSGVTYTEAYMRLNEKVSRQTTDLKRRIWLRKVLEAKGTRCEMWRVLKSLTDDKPNNYISIITDNGRACVSQPQKANAFMNIHYSVSSLKLTKETECETYP